MDNLHVTYYCADHKINIYYETGVYRQSSYSFIRDDFNIFKVSTDMYDHIGLEDGDRVSVVTFHDRGAMFLAFNHTKNRWYYYDDALSDSWYRLKEGKSLIGKILLSWKLQKAQKVFPESAVFNQILSKISLL